MYLNLNKFKLCKILFSQEFLHFVFNNLKYRILQTMFSILKLDFLAEHYIILSTLIVEVSTIFQLIFSRRLINSLQTTETRFVQSKRIKFLKNVLRKT